jgi:SAM-dependent methyltransferase
LCLRLPQFPPASFDFSIARFVVQHVTDPVALTTSVFNALREGGSFVIFDADDAAAGFLEPAMPGKIPQEKEKQTRERKSIS